MPSRSPVPVRAGRPALPVGSRDASDGRRQLAIASLGLFFVDTGNLGGFDPSGESAYGALSAEAC
jgi:hypothetical protein